MKLKSLFLATLAAMAMASCSNDNDPITDNGDQAEKNALLQFRISFGNSVNTRTPETGEQSGTEAGLDKEQTFSAALLIVAYQGAEHEVVTKTITRNEFLPVTTTENPASDGNYYQSLPFEVNSGKVKAYVVLNPGTLSTTDITGKMEPKKVEEVLKTKRLNTLPAAENSFVMYGASEDPTDEEGFTDLKPQQTTAVPVEVNRVVAKLKEETILEKLTASVSKNFDGVNLDKAVTVKLTNYNFTNLTGESYLVYQTENKIAPTLNVFDGKNNPTLAYSNTLGTEDHYDNGNVKPEAQITYCWENENTETIVNEIGIGDNITSIIYKGQITITGEEGGKTHTPGENVYVFNNKVYNHAELKDALPSLGLEDTGENEGTIAEYDAKGILKYEDGVCYYRQPILTGGSAIIKRNNVYKLKVSNILSLGYPTPIPPVKKTMMQLYITVNEWTVNVNEFNLGN